MSPCCKLCCLAVLLASLSACSKPAETPGERNVRELKEELQLGQTKDEAEKLLTLHKIEYGFDLQRHQFSAVVRGVSSDGIVRKDVQIIISLGTNDKVTNIEIRDVFTGP
jgi:hypothetical protein